MTVKPPKKEGLSALKVVVLMVAVLGVAFLLFKNDPYTAAAALEKKAAEPVLRKAGGQEAKVEIIPAKTDATGGRTFIVELSQLKNGAKGEITIKTRPDWAPLGAAQFHKLMDAGFYKDTRVFRVVNNFIIQFGIQGIPGKFPKEPPIKDDPVTTTNARGTLTFATSGPNTRTTQLFINTNTKGNKFLDGQGFAPFAEITEGMDIVDSIYADYGEKPNQGKIQNKGNAYLNAEFPNMSYLSNIRSV